MKDEKMTVQITTDWTSDRKLRLWIRIYNLDEDSATALRKLPIVDYDSDDDYFFIESKHIWAACSLRISFTRNK